eukprot:CAMPEP_0116873078 /NCGR_PEP_ID=MMETSP0463-20121206/4047_1 /TAXON_ID=181622 /ORGANISM="Strombidinopsis sp, Strain SopsisLIS2011" /LENGTH=63 /DNA_ID=CAMNT_0004514377 /DNA_START=2303 /DNA_END=2491 /DNA_ORIENTATION=+
MKDLRDPKKRELLDFKLATKKEQNNLLSDIIKRDNAGEVDYIEDVESDHDQEALNKEMVKEIN